MLYCCAYIWTGFGAGLLCVFGWVCGDFFEHVPLCVCVCFDCCFFIELLRDFVCPCVYTVREKVWTGANPLGELGAHTHRAGPAHNNTHRPHRWLPPQQMTSAAEESSCLPIDTFNHRSLTEARAFKTFGQQETFGGLSYILVTTFTLIFVLQHSHLWQVKKPKINSLSCKFRKEFFHQDQNISLLDLRLPLTGCFTEIFLQNFWLILLLY